MVGALTLTYPTARTSHPGWVSQEGIRRAGKRQRTRRPKGPYPRFLITPSCTVEATSTPSCV